MKRINWLILITSIFISLSFNLKFAIKKGLDYFVNDFHINFVFIIKTTIISIIIYFILYLLFKLLDKTKLNNKKLEITKTIKIKIFILILIPSLVYLIVHYPAVYLNDTNFILYSPIYMSYGHPLFYGIIMSLIFFSFKVFFSPSISVFIMSIIQALISSIIITEVIVWFNSKIKNKLLTIILILYYFLPPIIANYNIALNKDTPYSLMMLIFFVLIYEFIETKGKILLEKKYLIKLIIVSIITIYIRTNGIYVIIPTLFILFIVYGLKNHIIRYISIIVLIIVFSLIQTITIDLIGVAYLKREMYAVPIQQICYMVKYHPNELSNKDYRLLSKIIKKTKKTINKNYNEYEVDNIKIHNNFDDKAFNKYEKEFVILWLKNLPSNLSSYTKAYLLNTYHLWSIDKIDKTQSIIEIASVVGIKEDKRIYNKAILPKPIQDIFISFYKIFNTYINPAGCFILLLITNTYALYRKRKEVVLLSLPLLMTWLVLMIASPMSSALRYIAPYIYILPIIMLYTFKITRKDVKNGLSKKSKN